MSRRSFTQALALMLAVSGGLAAQESEPFSEVVEVNVVNVDVIVTDSDGNPVQGLEQADFLLLEDGKPVETTNFVAISSQRPKVIQGPTPAELDEVTPAAELEPPKSADPVTLVFYFDNSSLVPTHRNRVLDELDDFVAASAGSQFRYMVVAFNPGLELVEPITTEAAAVSKALERVAEMPASGLLAARERRSARDQWQSIYLEVQTSKGWGPTDGDPGPGNRRNKPGQGGSGNRGRFFDPCYEAWGPMLNVIDSFAQQELDRVAISQAGLKELTRSLVGVPGRKFVLYMSDGLAQIPGLLEYELLGQVCPDRAHELFSYYGRFDQTGTTEDLAAWANLNRVTLYPLDTTGLGGVSMASAEVDDVRFTPSYQSDSSHRENMRGTLYTMAEETGGLAFFNANSPDTELERMAQDVTDYYSLGFSPGHGWDGERHAIKVKLEKGVGNGYRVRYRGSYKAQPQGEQVGERTLAALLLGLEDNPLDIRLRTAVATPLDDGRYLVPLEISLSLAKLTSRPARLKRKCLLRVVLAIQDAEGEVGPLRERVIPLEISESVAAMPDGRHNLVMRLPVETGTGVLAIGVEDKLSSQASYLRTQI